MASPATMQALAAQVAAVVATSAQAGQKIKSYGLTGLVPVTAPGPASSSALDKFTAQAALTSALMRQAGQIIAARPPVTKNPAFTGKLTINTVFDTTSDVKWADNPNHLLAEKVVARVVKAFQDNIALPADMTVQINVGWTRVSGMTMSGGALGESMWFTTSAPNADIIAALAKLPSNALQRVAFDPANLASFWPLIGGANLQCTYPLAAALGLSGWGTAQARAFLNTAPVGWVGFGNVNWDYSEDGSQNTTGGFSFFGTVLHEISEVLGRACGGYFGDLVAWAAAGVRSLLMTGRRYVSTNGVNVIRDYNQQGGGDPGDFAGNPVDAFDAFTGPGAVPSRSPTLPGSAEDWQTFSLLGYVLSPLGLQVGGVAA